MSCQPPDPVQLELEEIRRPEARHFKHAGRVKDLTVVINQHVKAWQASSLAAFTTTVQYRLDLSRFSSVERTASRVMRTLEQFQLQIGYQTFHFTPCFMIFDNIGSPQSRIWITSLDTGHMQPFERELDKQLWRIYDPDTNLSFQQPKWYQSNGKTFPILELPRELRDNIYSHLVPHSLFSGPLEEGLLFSNKTISSEYRQTIARHSHLHFKQLGRFRTFLHQPLSSWAFSVSYIELSLDMTAMLDLSGIDPNAFHQQTLSTEAMERVLTTWAPGSRVRLAFQQLRLKKLTIKFCHPQDYSPIFWGRVGRCHMWWAAVFMTTAWSFMAGQPIELKGYIRQPIKELFEAAYHQAYLRRRAKDRLRGSLGLDLVGHDDEFDDIEEGGVAVRDVPVKRVLKCPIVEEPWFVDAYRHPDNGCVCPLHCDDMETWDEMPGQEDSEHME